MINDKDNRYKLETTNWTRRQYARRNIVLRSKHDKLDLLFLICATIGSSNRGWTMLDTRTLDINMQGTVLKRGPAYLSRGGIGRILIGSRMLCRTGHKNEKGKYDTEE